jgi:hypothetical protein
VPDIVVRFAVAVSFNLLKTLSLGALLAGIDKYCFANFANIGNSF